MKTKNFIIARHDNGSVKFLVSADTKDNLAIWSFNIEDAGLSTHRDIECADEYAARFGGYAIRRRAKEEGR